MLNNSLDVAQTVSFPLSPQGRSLYQTAKEESSASEAVIESHLLYPGAWVCFFDVVILEATVHLPKFQYIFEKCTV